MARNSFPSQESSPFLLVIVLILITIGVLMFFTWGLKKNTAIALSAAEVSPKEEGQDQNPELVPFVSSRHSTGTIPGKQLPQKQPTGMSVPISPVPGPVVIDAVELNWAQKTFDNGNSEKLDRAYKPLLRYKKEVLEPLLGLKTDSLKDTAWGTGNIAPEEGEEQPSSGTEGASQEETAPISSIEEEAGK